MNIEQIDTASALRLINRFKTGTNLIFGAHLFSVGRERLIQGAEQVFNDLEVTGDSAVRFIRGNYGVGKTNFCARLFNSALARGWTGAYIELAEGVALHEFQQIFSQIVDKLYAPNQLRVNPLNPGLPLGLLGILENYYKKIRTDVGLDVGADTPHSIRTDILGRVNTVLTRWRIYSDFAAAVRCYLEARLDGDQETLDLLKRWFRADPDVRLREKGILRPIQKINAKDHLRSLSCLLVGLGYHGLLIILDELERIMQESRTRRIKAYTLLRELIDNVDGENGMERTCFYCAAPPSQFESQKGFIEVESLASRIQEPLILNAAGPDPTGAIVNLDKAPLTSDDLVKLANRLVSLHRIARGWDLRNGPTEGEIRGLARDIIAKRPDSNSKVREFCVELISALETRYANA